MESSASDAWIAVLLSPDAAALAVLMSCRRQPKRWARAGTHNVDGVLDAGVELNERGLRGTAVGPADADTGAKGAAELGRVLERRRGLSLVAGADGGVEVGADLAVSVRA